MKSQKFPGRKTSDLTYAELMQEKTELSQLADATDIEKHKNTWLQQLGCVLEQLRERRAQRAAPVIERILREEAEGNG